MEFNGKTVTAYGEFGYDENAMAEHVTDKNNPHGVTATQAGAAPAGFGLGDGFSTLKNWNDVSANGFWRSNGNAPASGVWFGINCKDAASTRTAAQFAFNVDGNGVATEALRGRSSSGTWGGWGYVNPPLENGVEYRTTERFLGKPVYVKAFDFGEIPEDFGEKMVTFDSAITALVRIEGCIKREYPDEPIAFIPFPAHTTEIIIVSGIEMGITDLEYSGQKVYFAVYYTKD